MTRLMMTRLMMTRLMMTRFRRFAPLPTLVGLLVCVIGVATFSQTRPAPPSAPSPLAFTETTPTTASERDVTLTVVTRNGLTRSFFVSLDVPEPLSLRLEAILAELRERMIDEGVWPESLPVPDVFITDLASETPVAVLNLSLGSPVAISVAHESYVFAALQQTVQRNGVSEMRVLIDGEPSKTFLGHLALDTSLD